MKHFFKHFLKKNNWASDFLAWLLCIYLKFTYHTSKWDFVMPDGMTKEALDKEDGILFAIWHNRLAYSMYIFGIYKDIYGLASPHSDGKIISQIVRLMKYKIIEGSTNKNASKALREIIDLLKHGSKIVVTPDGPRGPVYKNGSVITKIAHKYNKKLIPVSCHASKYFKLNSWDQMMIPKPFSRITVIFGKPLTLTGNDEKDKSSLENSLNEPNS